MAMSNPPPLALGTDKTDYSRYDSTCNIITVRGVTDPAHQGQTCTLSLVRNDVYGLVASQVIPNVGASFTTTFDLNSSAMNDSDGVNRAIQGDYKITAALTDGTTVSVPITVSIVSVHQLRGQYLYGLTTLASEVVAPKQQPKMVPATFVEVSQTFVKDSYSAQPDTHGVVWGLVYNPSDATLGNAPSIAFAGGPAVALVPYSGLQDVILLDKKGGDWAHLQVDTFSLPTTAQAETIALDQAQLTDQDFIAQARLATSWVEDMLGFSVEPHLVVADRLAASYPTAEIVKDGATFYDDFNPGTGVFPNISLPLQFILAVKELHGWYNQQKVLNVPSVWIQRGAFKYGNIELVPTSGQASALTWESFPFAFASMQSRLVPGFWQYAVTAGLPDLRMERGVIREAIAKKCGCNLALFAASAYRAGISSRTTSRDNISFSESYTASAMYSTFAHLTIPWETWLKEQMPRIKSTIGGLGMFTTFV